MEKVLGFREKDGVITSLDDSYKAGLFFEKGKAKQVPVVSVQERDSQVNKACIDGFAEGSKVGKGELVEWLEKELDKIKGNVRADKGKTDYALGKNIGKFQVCNYLLKAVRLQAKEGGK